MLSLVSNAAGITEINYIESVLSGNSECDEDGTLNTRMIIMQMNIMIIMQNNRHYRQRIIEEIQATERKECYFLEGEPWETF